MVVLDDFHKSLLFKRFNLGYDCAVCNKRFYSKHEQLKHVQEQHTEKREILQCSKCQKSFGHHQILQLHMQIHALSDPLQSNIPSVKTEILKVIPKVSEDEPEISMTEKCANKKNISKPTSKEKTNSVKTVKKQIGLTKVKMEDCLRCDECSCIYIDEKDYHKHMRNFHQMNTDNAPKPTRPNKKCRSCCKHCRGSHCEPVKRTRATQASSNLIFRYNMRDNIKDRWSKMVSERLSKAVEAEVEMTVDTNSQVKVKLEPEDVADSSIDLSHLLSQVEVKIKTEPFDDYR